MRKNPIILKNRKIEPQKTSWTTITYSVLVLIASLTLGGCTTIKEKICDSMCEKKERIVVQRVEIPVAVDCPSVSIPARKPLPSVSVSLMENYRDLKGCVMNQEYLLNRVEELENILKVYQTKGAK